MLWSLAYGVQALREHADDISRIILTGGASRSPAVHKIATTVSGLPIAVTESFESVAVGAAKQAAWALSGHYPEWDVPFLTQHEPTQADRATAEEIDQRYRSVLTTHYGPEIEASARSVVQRS